MSLKEIFQLIIKKEKLTPTEFGDKIAMGKSGVYKVLKGETKKLRRSSAENINKVFPRYSVEALMLMDDLVDSSEKKLEYIQHEDNVAIKAGTSGIVTISEIVDFLVRNKDQVEKDQKFNLYIELKGYDIALGLLIDKMKSQELLENLKS